MMFFMYSMLAVSSMSLAIRLALKKPAIVEDKATREIKSYLKETSHWADEARNAQRSYQRLHAEYMQKAADFERLSPEQKNANRVALNELKLHVEQRRLRVQKAQMRYQELAY
ncbi:hypothetical protein AB4152_02660 [Vibrio breoganii]|uniref:hypothetical protein n=1 Tax=Vibrio breoganii TaxID=553239 RepID=UPI00080DC5DC|nr:hypothetical protein [Vibrio breoganii]OCH77542.1 hypothetical protein A6D95_06295 [Vibrio breoganii]PML25617.1 hypothetical protein BCT82_11975 [Vibrio breoganii]